MTEEKARIEKDSNIVIGSFKGFVEAYVFGSLEPAPVFERIYTVFTPHYKLSIHGAYNYSFIIEDTDKFWKSDDYRKRITLRIKKLADGLKPDESQILSIEEQSFMKFWAELKKIVESFNFFGGR